MLLHQNYQFRFKMMARLTFTWRMFDFTLSSACWKDGILTSRDEDLGENFIS